MVNVATAPLAVAVTPGPVKFNALASLIIITPSASTSIKLGTVILGVLVPLLEVLPVSTGISITGTTVTVLVLVVCPVPGPGATDGGADSGGPWGAVTVGICPVVPGPGGTGAGDRSSGLITTGTVPVFTGAGPCVAIFVSFRYDSDIYLDH